MNEIQQELAAGYQHLQQQRFQEAVQEFAGVTSRLPQEHAAWAALGHAQLLAGNSALALDSLSKARSLGGPISYIANLQAQALGRQRRWQPAIEAALESRAMESHPGLEKLLADLYFESGNFVQALEHWS